MEHNGENRNMPQTTLCRMGCGFYGSPTCEGMCSKCYKDVKQRRQQSTPTSQMAGRSSPTCLATGGTEAAGKMDKSQASGTSTSRCSPPIDTSRTPNVETATPTVPSSSHNKAAKDQSSESLPDSHGEVEATASPRSLSPADKDKKPKKHRCHTCKKKVGLTGFECRCGGLYCSIHRYSDKHECTFNYKEMAQAQIRKNNPVVVGEKIQKI